MDDLISAKYAIDNFMNQKNVTFIDATFHLPDADRNAGLEFNLKHIPNAQFFDIDKISDQSNALPHMIPSKNEFSEHISVLGIKNSDTVVIYDNSIFFSAARAWWLFKLFGHKNLKVIDGGLFSWIKHNGPTSSKKSTVKKSVYKSLDPDLNLLENLSTILNNLNNNKENLVLDARGKDRFLGKINEPRKGVKKGHIPQSKNLPILSIINSTNNCLISDKDLLKAFHNVGATDKNKSITMTCGSGITACGLAFAASKVGFLNINVYDGSWSEWGSNPNTLIETN